ncbi:MAG: hypothetical protein H6733_07950 [Alphaproteobacteria bacterium]|nr:hypothetical protein [Alphaproteobacteria bacterium]
MVVASLLALLSTTAQAQPPDSPTDDDTRTALQRATEAAVEATAAESGSAAPGKRAAKGSARSGDRKIRTEFGLRGRYLILPQGMMDIWFTDDTDAFPEWALRSDGQYCLDHPDSLACGRGRPLIHGWSGGVELAIKTNRSAAVLWFDWVDSMMKDGYWDDRDDPPRPDDGDYLVPSSNFGLVMFGVDYQFELPLVPLERTKGAFGFDLIVGTGLGLGIMVGQLDRYVPGENDEPSFELYDNGEPTNSTKAIPDFYPVLDLNLGFKFNFADRVSLRVEGGLHTLLYGGAGLDFKF